MRVRIDIKKVGDHWYPDLKHSDPNHLALDVKIERLLNKLDFMELGKYSIVITEMNSIIDSDQVIVFTDEDIERYLFTNDDFIMNVKIGEHQFYISSSLYFLLEDQYNFNFHKFLYKIELAW